MKKISILLLLVFLGYVGVAQLTLTDGSIFTTVSGTSTIVKGDLISTNASLENNGTLIVEGDLVNNTSALFNAASNGTFTFGGSLAQEITGDADVGFYGVTKLDNSAGLSLTNTQTGSNQTINGELQFTNGKISLNEFDLLLGATDPSGHGANNYVQTNGTGVLKRSLPADGITDIVFPVGNSAYNPIVLKNAANGITDTYGVLVLDNEPADASTNDFVDRSWVVGEETPGGSLLTVKPQWNETEELSGFDRSFSAVGLTNDGGANYIRTGFATPLGSNPYTQQGALFNGTGVFAVSSIAECADMLVYFKNSYGQYAANGNLKFLENNVNPWRTPTELVDGVFCLDTDAAKVTLKLTYGPQKLKILFVPTTTDYTFQMENVTVELTDNGTPIDGGNVEYVFSGWHQFGTGTTGDDGPGIVRMDMLPRQFHFVMKYDGLELLKTQTISPTNNFISFDVDELKSGGVITKDEFVLAAYPNPFTSNTQIAFTLNTDEMVYVAIYDINGRLVHILHEGVLNEGNHKLRWDADVINKGVYIVRFATSGNVFKKNIVKL